MKLISLSNLQTFRNKIGELFVAKELKTGSDNEYRVLSDNNLTDELVKKINEAGNAEVVTEGIETAKTEAVETSNAYTDTEVAESLSEAKSYADQAETDAVASAKTYTDTTAATAKSEAIESSNSYTDTEVGEALTEAKAYADTAESDAVATAKTYTDTAKTEAVTQSNTYTDEQVNAAKTELTATINTKISTAYKVKGSTAFASLPTPSEAEEGNVWNITDGFTTTDNFLEGAGKKYPAGTNIVCVEEGEGTFKFDVLPGFIDVDSFVKNADIEAVSEDDINGLFA